MPAAPNPALPPIHTVRGVRVMLDSDLARLYGVTTAVFNQAIRRNLSRFPSDFVFEISHEDHARLISQIVISNAGTKGLRSQTVILKGRGGRRKPSLCFTEHGAIMAATILRSPRAVAMSIYVVRAFVQMREALLTNAVILKRLAQVDRKLLEHDVVLRDVVERLAPLLSPPESPPPKRKIGFHPGNR
ncbi:MAG: ORF6N domain-containing protein [Candidatus Didemnitutus sp.]|nr:ORF6N domain-containing protein [Candidatus Didemnitutus sp.]